MAKGKTIAKKRTLTLRLNASESRALDALMVFTGKNTGAGALLCAGQDYVALNRKRDNLEDNLDALQRKHSELVDDIKDGLDAYGRIMKAIGGKKQPNGR